MAWWTKIDGDVVRHTSKIKAGWHLFAARTGASLALYRSDPRVDSAAVDVLPAERKAAEKRKAAKDGAK